MSLAKVKTAQTAPVPPTDADHAEKDAVASSQDGRLPYNALYKKYTSFSRKLKIYVDSQILTNAKIESSEPLTEEDGNHVVLSQKLLRSFVFTHNWIHMGRDADRYAIPDATKTDLEKVLGAELLDKYQLALRAKKGEVADILPKEEAVDASKWKGVVAYVKDHEKEMVVSVLEKACSEMKDELQVRKSERTTQKKPKKKSSAASSKSNLSSDGDASAEDKFKDLIADLQNRVKSIKFSKDGFKQYSEVQTQLDSFLFEATEEIKTIKMNLKKQFDKV